jgi:hypothetical protein
MAFMKTPDSFASREDATAYLKAQLKAVTKWGNVLFTRGWVRDGDRRVTYGERGPRGGVYLRSMALRGRYRRADDLRVARVLALGPHPLTLAWWDWWDRPQTGLCTVCGDLPASSVHATAQWPPMCLCGHPLGTHPDDGYCVLCAAERTRFYCSSFKSTTPGDSA